MDVLIFAACCTVAYIANHIRAYFVDLEFEREIEEMYADPDYIAKKREAEKIARKD